MEKAYLVTYNTDLKKDFSDYDRLYIGDEYCEHNMFYFLKKSSFLNKIKKLNKKISLTTPIISEKGMVKLNRFLKNNDFIDEIIVNDLGVFYHIKSIFPKLTIIWGNFLSGQNKDPYLKEFKDKETHKFISIDSVFYNNFFNENKIKAVELYNTFQGISLKYNFNIHLLFPFTIYSINRYCISNLIYNKKDYLTIVEQCSGCKGKIKDLNMELKIGNNTEINYFRGNKQFYKNDSLVSLEIFQKREVLGRKIFAKGAYLPISDGVINSSDEEIRSFSEISLMGIKRIVYNYDLLK